MLSSLVQVTLGYKIVSLWRSHQSFLLFMNFILLLVRDSSGYGQCCTVARPWTEVKVAGSGRQSPAAQMTLAMTLWL